MPDTQKSKSINCWGFLWVMALAASAGFGWGLMSRDVPAGGERTVKATRGNKESTSETKTPKLSAEELVRQSIKGTLDERELWRNVRSFSETEVKTAISELGNPNSYYELYVALPQILYYRWGELNPVAANAAAKATFPTRFSSCRQAVITAWINHGGSVAAWNAVKEDEAMWDCTRSVPGEFAEMLANSLSDLDDAKAFKEVARLNDENYVVPDVLCGVRARKASATPESRASFLAATAIYPGPYVAGSAREHLFREWAKRDIKSARDGVTTLQISDKEKKSLQGWIDMVERDTKRN